MERDIVQLMDLSIVKNDIFRCGTGIAKAITNVEPKAVSVYVCIAGSPIPGIIIGPDAPAPIQRSKVGSRVKLIAFSIKQKIPRCPHAVYFLIENFTLAMKHRTITGL